MFSHSVEYSTSLPPNTHALNTKALVRDTKTSPPAVVVVKHASCRVAKDYICFLNCISIAFFVLRIVLALALTVAAVFCLLGARKKCYWLTDGTKRKVICITASRIQKWKHDIGALWSVFAWNNFMFFLCCIFYRIGNTGMERLLLRLTVVTGGIDSCQIDAWQCFLCW